MNSSKTRLCLYRGLYWANQGLLNAVRALEQAEVEARRDPMPCVLPQPPSLIDELRRIRTIIEETRTLMNRVLAEWIESKE